MGADGKRIIKWVSKKKDIGRGLNCSGSGIGQVSEFCECGDEHLGPIKCGDLRG